MKTALKRPAAKRERVSNGERLPILENGDRMAQSEFHRRYEAYPDDVKIELVGGVVFMASPLRIDHSDYTVEISLVLGIYRGATPGVHILQNATTILGEESEPQPDLGLRILPEYAGQSRDTENNYVQGAPEFLIEVAYSTRALDMHQKRADYERAGAQEYLVLCVEEQELHWFSFKTRRSITPDTKGVYHSRAFPGLWIDGPALLAKDSTRVAEVVRQGLASPEHAAFVKRLEAARRRLERRNN